jgi:hypothetical protein
MKKTNFWAGLLIVSISLVLLVSVKGVGLLHSCKEDYRESSKAVVASVFGFEEKENAKIYAKDSMIHDLLIENITLEREKDSISNAYASIDTAYDNLVKRYHSDVPNEKERKRWGRKFGADR